VILSGRRINDNMPIHVAGSVIKLMAQHELPITRGNILVLGITFKENCPDIRNSKVVDVIKELQSYGTNVDVYDPQAEAGEVKEEYNLTLIQRPAKKYDAIILAVNHGEFKDLDWAAIRHEKTVVYDVKGMLDRSIVTARL
jgi:UDP-N-acetyl-D-galactosamine dehydrogenase